MVLPRNVRSCLDLALGVAVKTRAAAAYRKLMRQAENAPQIQQKVLLDKLRSHADSEFAREHRFDRIRSYRDYRSAVPVRDYEQLRHYIERMIDGNERALLGRRQPLLMLAMTSGSTDRPKYIPVTRQFIREYRSGWNAFGGKAMLDHPAAFMRPILQVTSPCDVERTPRGVPCGSISGLLAREQTGIVRRYYASPAELARIADADARYYAIMRFAVPRDVGWIVTASPATPLKLARTAMHHAERLIRDVRDGTLTPPTPIDSHIMNLLAPSLAPDPESALRLEQLMTRTGALLPREYWRLAFIANWTGGTLALHLQEFPEFFGATPVREIGLLATEGRVSIGIEPNTTAALLDVLAGFLEFAEENDHANAHARLCDELEIGGVYRVILTNSAGLFRYDLGDCVQVTGFCGRAPMLEFLHRAGRVSSMTGEKLTEWQVIRAIKDANKECGLGITNFLLAPVWKEIPFYRLYMESYESNADQLGSQLDRHLGRLNLEYASKRASSRLGEIQIVHLPTGVLRRWEQVCREKQAAAEQFKPQFLFTAPGQDAQLQALCKSIALDTLTGKATEPDTGMACP